ncbi:Protein TAR1 [Quillaja saponaria]|uniref:Protein TAR1 n=1 Tax=Quillaja saponaria TaxID=32244 RepID=A0AAD7KM96_QUISA|nr:Protein TAR1 [Quillaja saponaria]KAJ7941342.1 Protein TAR1 [Quillaja saponaria]KAJ7941560.1 Protein TAR1 [Quillaja saponaria]KAJ7941990.1 Protein TAR1 [Quillaja saponaria]KAJ7942087.1 Protein TAR1 [Quillaja saponaria]
MCKCRSHGTFPLFGLQSSHLNICYYHQDLHRRPLRPGSRPGFCSDRRALLLIEAWHLPRRPGIGRALQRHPFSGLVDSADERFARQYRCGPPPEFPLASPRSGIVHHLSGPDRYALTRTLLRRSRSVGGAALEGFPPVSFLAPCGFTRPLTRTHVRLLGPCFKTGRMGCPQADAGSAQMPEHAERRALPATIAATTYPRAQLTPGLGPPPQSASVRAPSRSADRREAVPHPTGTHRRPPSASLPTISSTL